MVCVPQASPGSLQLTLSRRYEAARGPRQRPGSASTCGVARAPEGWHKIVHACSWHTSGAPFLSMSWARYFAPESKLAPVCARPSDAPCARERGAWLQPDQSLSGPKCVRRASHGLDGQAAPADIGKRVAAEQHQVGVILIDPERDLCSAIRISELYTSEGILVPLEVGKRVVKLCRADRPRLPEIVFGVLHRLRGNRKAALVGLQHGSRGCVQNQTIDDGGPQGQVRVSTTPIRTRGRTDVRGRCPYPKSVVQ